eukprot:TRINITY_DN7611_c0_g2_i1.p1 TRINITY_DN7611_c0_g2~~TRINITY_DN7611_c0_g2_i1.p1  ORF type:complete len:479 (+),score=119.95 TRINITY_DN7611_c0_g2_i1:90-1439(+)
MSENLLPIVNFFQQFREEAGVYPFSEEDLERSVQSESSELFETLLSSLVFFCLGRRLKGSNLEKNLWTILRAHREKYLCTESFPEKCAIATWTPTQKIEVLQNLCDWVVEENTTLHDIATRSTPIGQDDLGNSYWFFGAEGSSCRLYRQSRPPDETFLLLCTNLVEVEELVNQLSPPPPPPPPPSSSSSSSSSSSESKSRSRRGRASRTRTPSPPPPPPTPSLQLAQALTDVILTPFRQKMLRAQKAAKRNSRASAREGIALGNILALARPRRNASRNAKYTFDDDDIEASSSSSDSESEPQEHELHATPTSTRSRRSLTITVSASPYNPNLRRSSRLTQSMKAQDESEGEQGEREMEEDLKTEGEAERVGEGEEDIDEGSGVEGEEKEEEDRSGSDGFVDDLELEEESPVSDDDNTHETFDLEAYEAALLARQNNPDLIRVDPVHNPQ